MEKIEKHTMPNFGTTQVGADEAAAIVKSNALLPIRMDAPYDVHANTIASVDNFFDMNQTAVWLCYYVPLLADSLHQDNEIYFRGFTVQETEELAAPELQPCFLGVHPPELIPYIMATLMNAEDPDHAIRFSIAAIPDDHFRFVRKLTNQQYREILSILADLTYDEIIARLRNEP